MIHGRSQEKKDAIGLKAEWLAALGKGLAKSELTLPVGEGDVRFPYYGDTLSDLVDGKPLGEVAEVIVRGQADGEEARFRAAVLEEVRKAAGVTDDDVLREVSGDVVERAWFNNERVLGLARLLDRYVPGSGVTVSLATHDVYLYLKNAAIRDEIETGVMAALTPGVETVVVAHSLGTVVAYNLLRRMGQAQGWKVRRLVTVGSPLGVGEIRTSLKSVGPLRCPECVAGWFNTKDPRDIVALYPLTTEHFPLDPATPGIENKMDVDNWTENRHGIDGYLDDGTTAKVIYDALVE
jgi:hypothetical protein